MRVYSLTPLLLVALLVAPKPKAPGNLRILAACPATGPCKLTATWTLPGSFRSTDSLKVQWTQTAPSPVTFSLRTMRGTSDTLTVSRTVEGAPYAEKLCITTTRPGVSSDKWPTTCATVTIPGTTTTVPDSVTGITISPTTVSMTPPGTIQFSAVVH